MKKYVEMKCPNCSATMTIKDNYLECPYCGTQLISFYSGSIESDVASIQLDTLLKEIENNKKEILIVNGKISSGNIDDIIANSGLTVAQKELKNGNYYSAGQYAKNTTGIEGTRICFLARFNCKNESFLQEKSVWDDLRSSDIPSSLIQSEAYGAFYSALFEFCKQRESAASESNALISDYLFKYWFLDTKIKDISGKDIYEILKRRANELCKKYPIFPEPWLALRIFDKNAISKMICAFQNVSITGDVLLNWSNNHFVSKHLNLSNETYAFKVLFSPNELVLLNNELTRRFSSANSIKTLSKYALKQNPCDSKKAKVGSSVKRIGDCFLAYPENLDRYATSAIKSFFNFAEKAWKNGSSNCWGYAGISFLDDTRSIYWFPTNGSKPQNETSRYTGMNIKNFDNYGLSFDKRLSPEWQDAFVELLYEHMETTPNNLTSYEIQLEDLTADFNPRGWIPHNKSIAKVVRITASW